MTDDAASRDDSPYLMPNPPTSTGRLILSRAFEHYCALHWGYSGHEIAAALRNDGEGNVIELVTMGARIIGEALAMDAVRCWARPKGGGEPVSLRPGVWELDDFTARFATCAIDPEAPFDSTATSHWIFVEADGWNALVEQTLEYDAPPRHRRAIPARRTTTPDPFTVRTDAQQIASDSRADRLVRLEEVKHRTGMSRSTIYRRMSNGTFPGTVELSGNIAAWREADIDEWLAGTV